MTRNLGGGGRFRGGSGRSRPPSQQRPEYQKIDFGKRLTALIIDFAFAALLGFVVTTASAVLAFFIPQISQVVRIPVIVVCYFLLRDYAFEGRGLGKNLMGLRVVDAATGQNPSLGQSVVRNMVFMLPFIVLSLGGLIFGFLPLLSSLIPVDWLQEFINKLPAALSGVLSLAGTLYVLVVMPMECYRAYSRDDSLRYGDQLAGTTIVESNMDFSRLLPGPRH